MSLLKTGVFGTSRKENEYRVPIHPGHLARIPAELRAALVFEHGYGEKFGWSDDDLARLGCRFASREELFAQSDLVLLPKPLADDLAQLRSGATLWGWPHCVQQSAITQQAIDRKLTLIAFEAMYHWSRAGARELHTFYKNNELAGYCGILHALELIGADGHYGPNRHCVVLSFGSVSRGAIYALQGRGFTDITIYTQRPPHLVADQLFGGRFGQMRRRPDHRMEAVHPNGDVTPLVDEIAAADIIVNGILQDTDKPIMFVHDDEVGRLKDGCLIADISCDLGMGFPFARPTSFAAPMFRHGHVHYYAVDHTPTYLWDAASWEISAALLPYMPDVLAGPAAWERNETIRRAIEIRDGVIQNPKILTFQRRNPNYPHAPQP